MGRLCGTFDRALQLREHAKFCLILLIVYLLIRLQGLFSSIFVLQCLEVCNLHFYIYFCFACNFMIDSFDAARLISQIVVCLEHMSWQHGLSLISMLLSIAHSILHNKKCVVGFNVYFV